MVSSEAIAMTKRRDIKYIIRTEADIPSHFDTEAEEAAFWDAAEITREFLDQAEPVPDGVLPPGRGRTRPVTNRLDDDVMRRLKEIARQKGKGYQTLVKEFITERLYEEEVREGLIARPAAAAGAGRS